MAGRWSSLDKAQIKQLLIQIKVFYSRFDAVEKDGNMYGVMGQTIDAWHRQIGWMEYDDALKILDNYIASENGSKTPGISLWKQNGKVMQKSVWHNAALDLQHGVIVWEPEKGTVFERRIVRENHGTYEDEDGYLWAMAGGDI